MDRGSFAAIGTLVTTAAALVGCGGTLHAATPAPSGDATTEAAPADSSDPAPPPAPRSVSEGGIAAKPPPPRVERPAAPPSPPPPVKGKLASRGVKRPAADAPPPPLPGTPIATPPEFSRLDDGKSRIWVEVSRNVDVTESRSPFRVVYRLRGAAMLQRSDQLPLQTGFFTTPVERVQIVPDGPDVDLVVLLREEVVPSFRVVVTPRGVVLQVDVPRSAGFGREEAPSAPEPGRPRARRGTKAQTLRRQHEPGEDSAPPMDDN